MSKYNFTVFGSASPSGARFGVDVTERYGYWEHRDGSEGGGLWFEPASGPRAEGLELMDYDGAASLPRGLAEGLRLMGFTVDPDFD